jgi:hypothetical protein
MSEVQRFPRRKKSSLAKTAGSCRKSDSWHSRGFQLCVSSDQKAFQSALQFVICLTDDVLGFLGIGLVIVEFDGRGIQTAQF